MGAGAQQRGNEVIRRQLWKEHEERIINETARRQIEIAEECNVFVRAAMDYIVEPKGLRKATIERAKTRKGWAKRHATVTTTFIDWINADTRNPYQYWMVSLRRAQAVHALFIFALGPWTIPSHITVPRAASFPLQ